MTSNPEMRPEHLAGSELPTPMGGQPLLCLRHVTKTFRPGRERRGQGIRTTARAVDDLSISVHRGELFGLVGPSGCGKTTTLRLILGLETADCGLVSFNDHDITAVPAERRGFGIVFQNYALFTEINVFDNIAFGLHAKARGRDAIRSRVEDLLALLRLPKTIMPKRLQELSAGEQQRVAIARALAVEPELLLLDEPLANLDAGLRRHVGEEIRRLIKQLKIAAIFVTHDQTEAFSLCDRMAVMRDGNVVHTGTPTAVYERPSEPWVAQFLGFQLFSAKRIGTVANSTLELMLEDTGWNLRVRVTPQVKNADRLIVAVRAEDVQIVPGQCLAGGSCLMPATVLDVSFGGPTSRILLGVGNGKLEALVLRGCEPSKGDACGLSISPDSPVVYPGPC
jgi:ABC-type Fe3+/spermidine/putrescine transport system ATPase subunit